MKHRKKSTLITGSVLFVLILIYFTGTVYFTDHFMNKTFINGVDCSMKHYDKTEETLKDAVKDHTLIILEKDCPKEQISAEDVDMEIEEDYDFYELARKQNRLKWPVLCFKKNIIELPEIAGINEKKAGKYIDKLNCMDDTDKVTPKNAVPEYNGKKFVIKDASYGNITDKEKTSEVIIKALKDFKKEVDLESNDCYIKPERTKSDSKLQETCAKMNNYCKAVINYDMISHTETVDKSIISDWITCDDELNITFDEKKAEEFIKEFKEKYDTKGRERRFITPDGRNAEVSGGTYGWVIDEKEETEELLKLIRDGAKVTREPVYTQRAVTHGTNDWGDNYCEIDLSSQYMWCVKSGSVAFECPVVTGKPKEFTTPSGVYSVINKAKNVTLIGKKDPETGEPIYRTPVSFWMPVTYNGVGMHDAPWQPLFGGDRYKLYGSHGCINMSYSSAAAVYELVYVGMPVIIHY